jgi:O-antigen ligase/tetratricopeptide (TPR) repeat protein
MESSATKEYLIKAVQIGIAASLFIPLVLLSYFGITPYDESSKALIFQCLVEVTFLFYLYLVLLDKNYLPKKSILLLTTSVFFLIEIISAIFGLNFYRSFFGNLTRGDGIVLHLHLLVFFVILVSIFKEKSEWINLFRISAVVSAISSIVAILQKFKLFQLSNLEPIRMSGTFVNSDIFGDFVAISIFLNIFVFTTERKKPLKILWGVLLFLNTIGLFLSGTRGAWVGLAAGILMVLALNLEIFVNFFKERKAVFFSSFIIVAVLLMGFFVVVSAYHEQNYFLGRMNDVLRLKLDNGRRTMWNTAFNGFLQSPILGQGGDSLSYVWDKTYNINAGMYEIVVDKPHNRVIEVMQATGTLGILAYLSIFGALFYLILKKREFFIASIFAGFFVCYFIENLFLFESISTYILFFLAAAFINNNFSGVKQKPVADYKVKTSLLRLTAGLVLTVLVAIIFYNLNLKTALAGMYIHSGDVSIVKEPEATLYFYSQAIKQNTFYDYDIRAFITDRINFILAAESSNEIKQDCINLFNDLELNLYQYMGKKDQQQNRLYSNVAEIYKSIYVYNKNSQNLAQMQNVLEKGIAFSPNFPVFYKFMAQLRILQNNYKEGQSLSEEFYKLTPKRKYDRELGYLALSQAYLDNNDFENGVKYGKKVLEMDYESKKAKTNETKDLVGFADKIALTYYNKLSNIEEAQKIYQTAMEIYPQYTFIWQKRLFEILANKK